VSGRASGADLSSEAAADLGPVAGVILAAGSATRFGGGKIRAPLAGRPLVAHVLAAARAAGLERIVLVLGRDAPEVRDTLRAADPRVLDGVVLAVNPAPERGLASSLRIGLSVAAADPPPGGILVLLGDQPRVRPAVIAALRGAAATAPGGTLAVVPRYAGDASPNPVLLLPPGWTLGAAVDGDRGLGQLLAGRADRVLRVPISGTNPDVDTPADLAALEEMHS
jgi:molybdenum cofactor cytidylyltransferase